GGIDLHRERNGALQGAVADLLAMVVLALLLALLAHLAANGQTVVADRELELVLLNSRNLHLDRDLAVGLGHLGGGLDHIRLLQDRPAEEVPEEVLEGVLPSACTERLPSDE